MSVNLPTFSRYLTEAYKFASLQANKKPLSREEREKVMSAGAVWHRGKDHAETPAIWKTADSQGNTLYVSHTHRAMAVEKTLDDAIRRFHNFIKDTA